MAVGFGQPAPRPVKGSTVKARRLSKSRQERSFRAAVLERDGYHCRICGRAVRRTLDHLAPDAAHVHHIAPRSTAPERKYEASNGLTVCSACHQRIHMGNHDESRRDSETLGFLAD